MERKKRYSLLTGLYLAVFTLCSGFLMQSESDPGSGKQVLWSRTDTSYNNFRIPAGRLSENRLILPRFYVCLKVV